MPSEPIGINHHAFNRHGISYVWTEDSLSYITFKSAQELETYIEVYRRDKIGYAPSDGSPHDEMDLYRH